MNPSESILADIETLIRCESPSYDLAAVAAGADAVAAIGERLLGEAPERIVVDGCTHLRWCFGEQTRVLLLGHVDTVWPIGTLERIPFSVSDGVLRGPGCFDMKTGVAMVLHAVARLRDRDGVCVLITGDEEVGSVTSRALIEAQARGCEAVLVTEASADGGALKIERKGTSLYRLVVEGRAAHSGLEPEKGVNAGVEAARLLLALADIEDAEAGTTVVPTLLSAGTTANTVPAEASVTVDVRARTALEQQRVDDAIRALRPQHPEAGLRVEGGVNRPPLERRMTARLFALAQRVAGAQGLPELGSAAVGGASDGNFTAGIGVPTLDGLGAVGGGAHAEHEYVDVTKISERTALLEGLLRELLRAVPQMPASLGEWQSQPSEGDSR